MQRGSGTRLGILIGGLADGAGSPAKRHRHGTAVEWYVDAAAAWRLAQEQQRLLLVLHLSGDLEEGTRL